MKSIRLIPVVLFAAIALLILKGIGLVTEGGYVLGGTTVAQAQEGASGQSGAAGARPLTQQDQAAAERASDLIFNRADPAPISSNQLDAVPFSETSTGEKIPIGSVDGVNQTEKAVLDRLSERRAELDILAQSLETRQALVDAAEKRLSERIATLEALEARINALVEEKKGLDDQQFTGLVGMYETMKPTDAAAIFDQLGIDVLLRVAQQMNPRKMAPIMAKMDEDRARELTMRLAEAEPEPRLDAPIDNMANLPQINGQ